MPIGLKRLGRWNDIINALDNARLFRSANVWAV